MPTVAEALAEYAAGEQTAPLSGEVRHHAKRALIDWFAALLPGALLPPATLLAQGLADELGHGQAIVYGSPGRRASLRAAALINATASHTIEFDDIFRDAVYHPGCPVIGASLAAAQARGADGEALLRAIVVGYEVSTRIGVAVQPSHYKFWHTTGTIGTFGAAAGVATVLKLDAGRTAHALATAGTFAAALQQAFRSDAMSKPLHAGHAADAGAMAALGAAHGVTGALDVLEGAAGFGAAMSENPDWSRATEALGSRYNITRMTFKNHGCCGHCFAAIDGALALQAAHAIAPEAIERITIGGYRATVEVTGRKSVATPFEGRFSTPYTVATALVHGNVRIDAFTPPRLADPAVQALMQRVDVVIDPQCAADFPARRSARITFRLRDGTELHHYQATRRGDPDAPLSDGELTDKFFELAAPAVGQAAAATLLERLWKLDTLADVRFPATAAAHMVAAS
ncbi:MAG: MmgE/PrpD family protein [Rhodospirillales bacterium]|nr:MmgE/PrpD family protein [Rhodospirillales bacterium]